MPLARNNLWRWVCTRLALRASTLRHSIEKALESFRQQTRVYSRKILHTVTVAVLTGKGSPRDRLITHACCARANCVAVHQALELISHVTNLLRARGNEALGGRQSGRVPVKFARAAPGREKHGLCRKLAQSTLAVSAMLPLRFPELELSTTREPGDEAREGSSIPTNYGKYQFGRYPILL